MTDPNMPGVHTDLGPILHDTKLVAYEVVKAAAAAGHPLFYVWGIGGSGDHANGIALDFMVYADGTVAHPGPIRVEVGNWVADYLWANRLRLGVRYTIYNRRIRSRTGTPPNVWLPYHGTPDPHTNHVHMSRLQSGRPAYQPPHITELPKLFRSYFNAARSDIPRGRAIMAHPLTVHVVERSLRDFGFAEGPAPDGHYGEGTDRNVRAFQRLVSPGDKPDGILGPLEWERLAAGPDAQHPARFIPYDAPKGT